ncbi:MAG: sulfatase-like hydrolase/transferase [Roseiflexaceae bacterium]|nr:sulfatase-like hydrolase/transferase [Roseiflexaceae bacterium]
MQRPDILLLVLDTQRRDRLSCYGSDQELSPQLDAFAARAARFTAARAPAQWTVPTHASMFTGVYPAQHGAVQTASMLPESLPTLAERLQVGGYHTAAFCNNPLVGVVNNGLRRGFNSFLNYSGLLTSRPNQAGAPATPIGRYRQWFKRLVVRALNAIQDSFARSDAALKFSFTPLMVPLWQTALSFKGNTVKSLDDAARLLVDRRGVERGQPVFAFVNLMGTHMPYHPPRQQIARHAPQVLQSPAAQRYLRRFNGDVFGWLAPLAGEIDAEHGAILSGMYNAEVAAQDAALGEFFQKLQARGTLDRTMIIACADHGEHLGEKQFVGHSISLYSQLTHVPLIIRDPRGDLPAGTTLDADVSTRRIFHTALDAADLADEQERAQTLAAPSAELPLAESTPLANVVRMLNQRRPQLVNQRRVDQQRRAVWRAPYKLIQTGDDQFELFDTRSDPAEITDLSAILPEVVDELRDQLQPLAAHANSASPNAANDDPLVKRRLRDLGYLE